MSTDEMPEDFNVARKNVRPIILVRNSLELIRQQIRIDGGDPDKFDIPEIEIGSHFGASLVYDFHDTMRSIGNADLSKWGTTFNKAMVAALENLNAAGSTFRRYGDSFYTSVTKNGYDACRVLMPPLFDRFKVKGDLIVLVPNLDRLLVCGSKDDQSLQFALEIAKSADQDPRPLAPLPLRLEGDKWVDWFPERDHPLFKGFQELAKRFVIQRYSTQGCLLEQIHEMDGIDVFVACIKVLEQDDGTIVSCATWAKGVDTLLPKVDWIAFGYVDDQGMKIDAIARWEKVEQVVGHLLQPIELYPPRFRVTDYPTAAELAELGMARICPKNGLID